MLIGTNKPVGRNMQLSKTDASVFSFDYCSCLDTLNCIQCRSQKMLLANWQSEKSNERKETKKNDTF